MFSEILDPWTALFMVVFFAIGFVVIKRVLNPGKMTSSVFSLLIIIPLIIALGGFAEQFSYQQFGVTEEIKERAKEGLWDISISADVTAGDWKDTIVADADLWDANQNVCNDGEDKCTALIQYLYSSGPAIVPDEVLVQFTIKNDNPDFPKGITACDNGCWPLLAKVGAIPMVTNSTDGNSLPLVNRNSDYKYEMYWEDKSGTGVRCYENDDVLIGLFSPGESDATIRFGLQLEPAPFGFGGVQQYDSWFIYLEIGNSQYTVELQVILIQ